MISITNKMPYARYLLLYGGLATLLPLFYLWRRSTLVGPGTILYIVFIIFLLARRYVDAASYEDGRLEITSHRFGVRRQQVFDTGTVQVGLTEGRRRGFAGGIPGPSHTYKIFRITEGSRTLVKFSTEDGFKEEDLANLEQTINHARK